MGDTSAETRPSVSLLVPCRAEYVSLCRLVAGTLAIREAIDEETAADLKVVISEAFNCFLGCGDDHVEGSSGAESEDAVPSVRVDFTVAPEAWMIVVSNPDLRLRVPRSTVCDPMSESELGLRIIEALVDSLEFSDNDREGSVFRLVKNITPWESDSE